MIAMSSFLMNSGSSYVVDPKFPPSEEYSQSSYIPAAASDYYVPHQVQHYHGYHHHSVNSGGGVVNGHPSSASMGYYGQHPSHGGAAGYGGAYGTPCGIAPGQQAVPMTGHVAPTTLGHHHHHHSQQQHQQQSPGLIQRSPAPSPTPSLTSMVTCPSQQIQAQQQQIQALGHQQLQHQHVQPLHQQQLNSSHLQQQQSHGVVSQALMQHDQLSHLGSMVAQQASGQQLQTQTQIQQQNSAALQLCQPPTPNSPESDCDDGSDMSDDSHNPVIYPWMKKIHVAGARKSAPPQHETNYNKNTALGLLSNYMI